MRYANSIALGRFKNFRITLFKLVFIGAGYASVVSADNLGTLRLSDLLVRPSFYLREPSRAQFVAGESTLGVEWLYDSTLRAQMRVGSAQLIGQPSRFSEDVESDLALIEAYAEWSGGYGQVRAGLLPLGFGLEGSMSENDLIFPRSQLFQRRVVGLRDLGFQYAIEHNGFFTSTLVHNGESGRDRDGRLWVTPKWGWKSERLTLGFQGQAGSTKAESTMEGVTEWGDFDRARSAKWRLGGGFLGWKARTWALALETYFGEMEQGRRVVGVSAGHMDVHGYLTSHWSAHMRLDHYDPSHKTSDDRVFEGTLGLGYRHAMGTSHIYFFAKKVVEQGQDEPNDELMLVWRLTSVWDRLPQIR